jgi:hypothetical protein
MVHADGFPPSLRCTNIRSTLVLVLERRA